MFGFLSRVKPDCAHRLMEDRMRTCQNPDRVKHRVWPHPADAKGQTTVQCHGGPWRASHGVPRNRWVALTRALAQPDAGSPALRCLGHRRG